jgi:hypothetical protein
MSNSENPNSVDFWVWFGRNFFRLLSFVAAGALIFVVIAPLTSKFEAHATKNIADIIPIGKNHVDTSAAPPQAGTNVITTEQATNLVAMNVEQTGIVTKQETKSSTPHVWAYGLQLAAFVAVLGTALWAIVALCRSDA